MRYGTGMCRSIQILRGADPPATDAEIREAAVDEVAAATRRLLDGLVAAPGSKRPVPVQRLRATS